MNNHLSLPTSPRRSILIRSLCLAALVVVTGCSQPSPVPSPTPAAIATITPAATAPLPSVTPSTEPTNAPTDTSVPASPTVTAELQATPTALEPTATTASTQPVAVATSQSEVASPSPSPTVAATPKGRFALGMRIDGQDSFDFWNKLAGPNDVASSGEYNISKIATAKAGNRALTVGHIENVQTIMDSAKAQGIHTVIFNREQTQDCKVLTTEEATAYRIAKQDGLTLVFAPTGVMLKRCYQQNPDMVANADVIFYQTEAIQGKDPNYLTTVKTLVQNVKAMKPGIPVWVQISVNPPANRNISAAEIIQTINSLEDGSPGSPDVMYVFYASEDKRPGRLEVLKQVMQAFRTAA